jgi:putative endonuclease
MYTFYRRKFKLNLNIFAIKPSRKKQKSKQFNPKPPKVWAKKDEDAHAFFVYILKLDNGVFYVGHTRELRERLLEHKDGTAVSTAGKHPKLQYFEVFPTREAAMIREAEIKKIRRKDNREILRMILHFYDLIRELDFD